MKRKRVDIFSFSDFRGGAAKAALIQYRSVMSCNSIDANFYVAEKKKEDSGAIGPNKIEYFFHFIKRSLSYILNSVQITSNQSKHSLNIFSSSFLIKKITASDAAVIHFHWINNDCFSIEAIKSILEQSSISKVIFTLHDEWLFSGSEHCIALNSSRYIEGYNRENRDIKGIDLDRWTFNRKYNIIKVLEKNNVIITVPSTHLKQKAHASLLLRKCRVEVVGNVIDVETFKDQGKAASRKKNGLATNDFIFLFGASDNARHIKGGDLLEESLRYIDSRLTQRKITLLVFGNIKLQLAETININVINLGFISGRKQLAEVYSTADFTLVPSRVESFGQVAAESLACETPVIGYDGTGLIDIIRPSGGGYLVQEFSPVQYGDMMLQATKLDDDQIKCMGKAGRQHILQHYSMEALKNKWKSLYGINEFCEDSSI